MTATQLSDEEFVEIKCTLEEAHSMADKCRERVFISRELKLLKESEISMQAAKGAVGIVSPRVSR